MNESICWYCRRVVDSANLIAGESIGNMVFSSEFRVSTEYPPSSNNAEQGMLIHGGEDCVRICRQCLIQFDMRVGPLEEQYIQAQLHNLDQLRKENHDYDTDLLEFNQKKYYFGCWFGSYPSIGVRHVFHGMSLKDVMDLGFRFSGSVVLGSEELDHFLARGGYSDDGPELSGALRTHLQDKLGVRDQRQLRRLALVRPQIFDVTISRLRSSGRT